MGPADKIIRFIIAAVIGVLYFMNIVSGTLGIVLLGTCGYFCAYKPRKLLCIVRTLLISTSKTKE